MRVILCSFESPRYLVYTSIQNISLLFESFFLGIIFIQSVSTKQVFLSTSFIIPRDLMIYLSRSSKPFIGNDTKGGEEGRGGERSTLFRLGKLLCYFEIPYIEILKRSYISRLQALCVVHTLYIIIIPDIIRLGTRNINHWILP